METYRVISTDSHVFEPPDLWTSRTELKFRDRAPHVIHRVEDDTDWWVCEGQKGASGGSGSQLGKRFDAPETLNMAGKMENVRAGCYIPEEHLKDMDLDGVEVSIVYPTQGLLLYSVPDGELLSAVCRAYNNWLADFCQPFPKRSARPRR